MSGNEKYLKGRTSGVEGTFGKGRSDGVEKTVISGENSNSGSLDSELKGATGSMYSRAVADSPDPSKRGDQALRDR